MTEILEKLTEEELNFCESWFTPKCLIESSFTNWDNLAEFDENKFSDVRFYQEAMISNESIIDFDATAKYHNLNAKQKFQLRKNVSDIYNFAGRKIGKSLATQIIFLLNYFLTSSSEKIGFASVNLKTIAEILDRIKVALETHPILSWWKEKLNSSTAGYKFMLKNGIELVSINFKLGSKAEGQSDWYGKHVNMTCIEEASFEGEKVALARKDALAENGAIMRVSGMGNFTKDSPAGKMFFDPDNKKNVMHISQTVSPAWDDKEKRDRIKSYGSEDSLDYRVNVHGEVIVDAEEVIDLDKVQFDNKKILKIFELNKDNFHKFDTTVIVERPSDVDEVIICADSSDIGITDVAVFFKQEEKYYYVYNIVLRSVGEDNNKEFFKWLLRELKFNYFCIDGTDASGRSVALCLTKEFGENGISVASYTSKVDVDYVRDTDGDIIYDVVTNNKGEKIRQAKTKQEWATIVAVRQAIKMLYNGYCVIPQEGNEKIVTQLSSLRRFITKVGGVTYKCIHSEDHAWQSIPEYELISCKIDNKFISDKVSNIYNKSTKVLVPTYNKGNLIWQEGKIVKQPNKGNKIYSFKLNPTSHVDVTEGHSMLIWDNATMDLKEVMARDVKVNDYVMSVDNFKQEKISDFETLKINFSYKYEKFIDRNILVNDDFAYLLGWACAEGCVGSDGCYTLSLNYDDPAELLLKLSQRVFNINTGRIYKYINNWGNQQQVVTIGGGRGVGNLIESLVGKCAKNKKIPDVIFNSPDRVKESFLRGLIEGDGDKKGKLTTVSRVLAGQVNTLFKLLGYDASFYYIINKHGNKEFGIKKGTKRGYYHNIPREVFPVKYQKNNKTLNRELLNTFRYYPNSKFKNNKNILDRCKDFNFKRVCDIKVSDYDGDVYDISVPGNNNFVAGMGNIVVHNSLETFFLLIWNINFAKIAKADEVGQIQSAFFKI